MRFDPAAVISRPAAMISLIAALHGSPQVAPALDIPGASVLEPPQWVMTDNGAALQRQTEANSKLTDKSARKVFDAGVELANRAVDEEEQKVVRAPN